MSASARRLVLLRHGQTAHNAARIWQGRLDTDLSELGRAQAAAAGPAVVERYAPSLLVSSPLRRAVDTAAPLAAAAGLIVTTDPDLAEIDVGSWQGLSADEVAARDAELLARIDAGEDLPRGGTGETFGAVMGRTAAAAARAAQHLAPGGCAVLVTHGVAARALVGELTVLGRGAWDGLVGLSNCQWAVLREDPSGPWRLEGWALGAAADARFGPA